jgi:hypothetical protein
MFCQFQYFNIIYYIIVIIIDILLLNDAESKFVLFTVFRSSVKIMYL